MAIFPNPPTMVIQHPDYPEGVAINAADFDAAKHKRIGERAPPRGAAPAVAVESED